MELSISNRPAKTGFGNLLLVILRRMIAIFFIVFALFYWAKIVGFGGMSVGRFDEMPEHWRVASVILAVAMPIASIGLWGLFSWGTSCWLAVVAFELLMYIGFPDRFGSAPNIIWFHCACLAAYISIKISLRFNGGSSKAKVVS